MKLKQLKPAIAHLPPRIAVAGKYVNPFYQGREWRTLVQGLKRQRGWCVVCGSTHRLVADHIIEIKDGGAPLDPANIQFLCLAHHNAKTAAAKAARIRKQ